MLLHVISELFIAPSSRTLKFQYKQQIRLFNPKRYIMAFTPSQEEIIEEAKSISLANANEVQKLNRILEQFIGILPEHETFKGIFRVQGNEGAIGQVLPAYLKDPNKVRIDNLGLSETPDITGLVKKALKGFQPNPKDLSPQAVAALRNFKDKMLAHNNDGDVDERVHFHTLIEQLVQANAIEEARLFYQLMYIARKISNQSETNSMTEMNMAIALLGPNIQAILSIYLGDDKTENALEAMQQMQPMASVIESSLKSKEGLEYFSKTFEARYPECVLSSAQDVVKRAKSKPENKAPADAGLDELNEEPGPINIRSKNTSVAESISQAAKVVIASVGDYIKKFDLEKAYNAIKGLFSRKKSSKNAETHISAPIQTSFTRHSQKVSTRPHNSTTTAPPTVSAAMPLDQSTSAISKPEAAEPFIVTRESSLAQLKAIDKEMMDIMKNIRQLTPLESQQMLKKANEFQEKIDIIFSHLPASQKHRVTPMRMDLADLKSLLTKKSMPIHGMEKEKFDKVKSSWEQKTQKQPPKKVEPARKKKF